MSPLFPSHSIFLSLYVIFSLHTHSYPIHTSHSWTTRLHTFLWGVRYSALILLLLFYNIIFRWREANKKLFSFPLRILLFIYLLLQTVFKFHFFLRIKLVFSLFLKSNKFIYVWPQSVGQIRQMRKLYYHS